MRLPGLKCENGHELEKQASSAGLWCDYCCRHFQGVRPAAAAGPNRDFYGCRRCDFDTCAACYLAKGWAQARLKESTSEFFVKAAPGPTAAAAAVVADVEGGERVAKEGSDAPREGQGAPDEAGKGRTATEGKRKRKKKKKEKWVPRPADPLDHFPQLPHVAVFYFAKESAERSQWSVGWSAEWCVCAGVPGSNLA
jgi:hypothetical protein